MYACRTLWSHFCVAMYWGYAPGEKVSSASIWPMYIWNTCATCTMYSFACECECGCECGVISYALLVSLCGHTMCSIITVHVGEHSYWSPLSSLNSSINSSNRDPVSATMVDGIICIIIIIGISGGGRGRSTVASACLRYAHIYVWIGLAGYSCFVLNHHYLCGKRWAVGSCEAALPQNMKIPASRHIE